MANRRAIRERLGALMTSELTGVGHTLAKAYAYPVGDLGGAWPFSILGPEASSPSAPRGMGTRFAVHRFKLQAFVKYAEIDDTGSLLKGADGLPVWDEEDAVNALDAFQAELAAFLQTHRTDDGYWSAVDYSADTEIDIIETDGGVYLRETYHLALSTN